MRRCREAIHRRRTWTLGLVALLFLGSVLSSSAHWIATPHRLCSLHGALEHGTLGHEEHGAPADSGDASAHQDVREPVYRSGGHGHEECPFSPWARTEILPLPDLASEAGWLARARVPVWVRVDPLPDRPLHLLAPSRSPPSELV